MTHNNIQGLNHHSSHSHHSHHSHQSTPQVLSDLLASKAAQYPHKNIIQFVHANQHIENYTYQQLHDKAISIACELNQHHPVNTHAILLYPSSAEFIIAFWACIYAGIIPIPIPLPLKSSRIKPQILKSICEQHSAINSQTDSPTICLTNSSTFHLLRLQKLQQLVENIPLMQMLANKLSNLTPIDPLFCLGKMPIILTDKMKSHAIFHRALRKPTDVLFHSYFSVGSYDHTKQDAAITHQQAFTEVEKIIKHLSLNECSRLFISLPHYQDLAIMLMAICPIYSGCAMRFCAYDQLLKDPLSWLEKLDAFRADTSVATTELYRDCCERYDATRLQPVDLYAWTRAIYGVDEGDEHEEMTGQRKLASKLDHDIHSILKKFADCFAPHGFDRNSLMFYHAGHSNLKSSYSKRKASIGSSLEAR